LKSSKTVPRKGLLAPSEISKYLPHDQKLVAKVTSWKGQAAATNSPAVPEREARYVWGILGQRASEMLHLTCTMQTGTVETSSGTSCPFMS